MAINKYKIDYRETIMLLNAFDMLYKFYYTLTVKFCKYFKQKKIKKLYN